MSWPRIGLPFCVLLALFAASGCANFAEGLVSSAASAAAGESYAERRLREEVEIDRARWSVR